MTLDKAKENFKQEPNRSSATDYRVTALEYYDDGMIGEDTLLAAIKETVSYCIRN